MGSVLSYSGLTTKIRAMQSKLITEDQLQEIIRLPGVPQITAYLKRTPAYADEWAALDENHLHRGQIEKMLKASIFRDFSKIYSFANAKQRTFLDLYSKRYEIRVLKELMTNLFDHRETDPVDLSPYRKFFSRHSGLNLDALTACRTMP
ncbi:MAG: V-type ATPase subunit, partial [Eubacteriales bacterium]|nr:V-type ATPase subunit [Eubacteriales bacterium]